MSPKKLVETISVAKHFSQTPGPRWIKEGEYSGEEFRLECLGPAFLRAVEADGMVLIDLDGAEGFASSFLEEAFGGLVRQYPHIDPLPHLDFKSDEDPYRKDEIREYIEEERKRLATAKR